MEIMSICFHRGHLVTELALHVLGVGADVPATIGDAVPVLPGIHVQPLERLDGLPGVDGPFAP
jgi:hypothetical protein